MRKVVFIVFLLSLFLGLGACQDSSNPEPLIEEPPASEEEIAPDQETTEEPKPDPDPEPDPDPDPPPVGDGVSLGTFKFTHYYMVFEADYPGAKNTNILYWKNGSVIATVSTPFYDKVRVEGTGYLEDGRLINLYGKCPFDATKSCFTEKDTSVYPYGAGSHDNPLHPYRSVAADLGVVAFDTVLYVPALKGLTMPDEHGIVSYAPFIHDGCVAVEDEGSSIEGNHLDFFVLSEKDDDIIDGLLTQDSNVEVFVDSPHCVP